MNKSNIPKIIWFLWFQGYEQAPEIVKICHERWKKLNPDYEVIFLDEKNIEEYIPNLSEILGNNASIIRYPAKSDIIRINLLAKYGGVWTDATVFPCVPLDNFINQYPDLDFFAFLYRERKDTLIDNWFMVSSKDCYLTQKMCEEFNLFWINNSFQAQWISNRYNPGYEEQIKSNFFKYILIEKIMKRNTFLPTFLVSFPLTKILKVYPYFSFHYIFSKLIFQDKECKRIFDKMPKLNAEPPQLLFNTGVFTNPIPNEVKESINKTQVFMYKLTWRIDLNKLTKGCSLDYLISKYSNHHNC